MSKGGTVGLLVATLLLCWGFDILARQQTMLSEREGKRFNWFQFLMVPFGVLVSPFCWKLILDFNLSSQPTASLPIGLLATVLAAALLFLLITERLRPQGQFDPRPQPEMPWLDQELPERFCLVAHELPRWWLALCVVCGMPMLLGGLYLAKAGAQPWIGMVVSFSGVLLLLFSGGFRLVVYPRGVEITLGVFNLPLKKLSMSEITSAEVKTFSPLADFGGWGLRLGRDNTTGYIVSGEEGVLVRTEGRNYLFSTEQARVLADGINQVKARQ